ncbi:response regulator transcription factor [Escherichia albertii]|nr:LuxR C-terminal-related transcriptional regulator [Escherichia albertii]MCZ8882255.1 LuxR C-terminal-related transcriptional regulator [Escherichia albertii]
MFTVEQKGRAFRLSGTRPDGLPAGHFFCFAAHSTYYQRPWGAEKKSDSPLTSLTPRELEVLRLCACGLRVKDIARKLNRSECTVAVHKHNAMQKLELTSNMQLLNFLHSQEQD